MLAKHPRSLRPRLLACAAAGALACAGAASAGEEVTTVDALIITSASLEQTLPLELSKYGNDIEIIDAETISELTYIDTADALRMQTPGLPIRDATKIAVTIGPDGVAKLRAEAGRVDPDRLGDRNLW